MTHDKYDRLVKRAVLEALAAAEGRLRAGAEEREVSAERMRADVEALALTPEQRDKAEEDLGRLLAEVRAMRAEADALRARAPRLAGAKGNVSRAPAEAKRIPSLEDVIHTLEHAASMGQPSSAEPGGDGAADLRLALVALRDLPSLSGDDRSARLSDARRLLARIAWPAGDASAYAQAALHEVDSATARLP